MKEILRSPKTIRAEKIGRKRRRRNLPSLPRKLMARIILATETLPRLLLPCQVTHQTTILIPQIAALLT
jgi:hypothetical protein